MFEDRYSHFDTAEFLADAGFAVVAINHSQDSRKSTFVFRMKAEVSI
jgi:hypothetical protein